MKYSRQFFDQWKDLAYEAVMERVARKEPIQAEGIVAQLKPAAEDAETLHYMVLGLLKLMAARGELDELILEDRRN